MGEIADLHVARYASGRWGAPIPKQRQFAKTTRAAIAGQRFSIVEVVGGRTNRFPGTRLVVCEQDTTTYWVWAACGVTGIAKEVCREIEPDLNLNDALRKLGRKLYRHPA